MKTIAAITSFLDTHAWFSPDEPVKEISFLAAGEYNENYRVVTRDASYVFRINHGSQLGLEGQIGYEFAVLHAVAGSDVTPRPYRCEPSPGLPELGKGVLLMEYLPGRPLRYTEDWQGAAAIFAAVHGQPTDDGLLVQADPVLDIARESEGLINRFPDHPLTNAKQRLLAYHADILELAEDVRPLFADDPLVIVNTEVNSHNFIVDDSGAEPRYRLVDWEKAVVSSRFQDIGHFLVPTTTLWKTDYRFSPEGKRRFVDKYLELAGLDMDLDTAMALAGIMERTILLRAMSWCYMAYHEYTASGRALKNADTFEKIDYYLSEMECFFELSA